MLDIDNLPFPNVGNSPFYSEFHVGNMLPQMGSTKGFDSNLARTSIEDVITTTNNKINSQNSIMTKSVVTPVHKFVSMESNGNRTARTGEFKIEEEYFKVYNDRDYAYVKIEEIDKPLRGRSEVLIMKDDEVYLCFEEDKYRIPGGGWNKGESHEHAAIREAKEESQINCTNVKYATTRIDVQGSVPKKCKDENIPEEGYWYGYFTKVFIAEYDKKFSGHIDEEDKDTNMIKKGRFYQFEEVKDKLYPEHRKAIEDYLDMTTMESTKQRVNDKGEKVPEICPKCGSKIGLYLRGEPVYLCSNKKCGKYYGTLPFPKHTKESTDDTTKISLKELQECRDKNYPIIFIRNNKTREAFESELKRFDDMIEYAKEQRDRAPEKSKLKDVLKDAHKNGMRAGIASTTFGQAGLTTAISTQKNTPLNKFGWESMINDLKKNRDSIELAMNHNKFKNKDSTVKESTKNISHVIMENVIFNRDNTELNIDKFESGKSNILLVTGLSGSGKSTIAQKISSKFDAEWVELDVFEHCGGFNDTQLKEAGEVFYDYLSTHKTLWEKLKNKKLDHEELRDEITKFVKYCISWCKNKADKKWIIEGVQIYSCLKSSDVKSYPLIIVGVSMKNSILQRFKRNGGGKIKWGEELKNEFQNLLAWYFDEEKKLKSFSKDINESSIDTCLNSNYDKPYSYDEIVHKYGKFTADRLMKDPAHKFRATTGIELIHREPTLSELHRIYKNWCCMSDSMKQASDKKSMELFGCDNITNYNNLIKTYEERDVNMINTDNIVEDMMMEFFGESSNGGNDDVPDKIEPVVQMIESKGYQVKYASPGYSHTRFDNDRNKDGVINNKLVTTGRIIFSRNYEFKTTPDGWEWKVLDNGAKALYVKQYTYNKKMGNETEAFEKWQNHYMASIKKWAANLPNVGTSDSSDYKPDRGFAK